MTPQAVGCVQNPEHCLQPSCGDTDTSGEDGGRTGETETSGRGRECMRGQGKFKDDSGDIGE